MLNEYRLRQQINSKEPHRKKYEIVSNTAADTFGKAKREMKSGKEVDEGSEHRAQATAK